MTMFCHSVSPTDPLDMIRARIEELKVMLERVTDPYEVETVKSEIRWSERALERSADVVRTADGLTYFRNTPA